MPPTTESPRLHEQGILARSSNIVSSNSGHAAAAASLQFWRLLEQAPDFVVSGVEQAGRARMGAIRTASWPAGNAISAQETSAGKCQGNSDLAERGRVQDYAARMAEAVP